MIKLIKPTYPSKMLKLIPFDDKLLTEKFPESPIFSCENLNIELKKSYYDRGVIYCSDEYEPVVSHCYQKQCSVDFDDEEYNSKFGKGFKIQKLDEGYLKKILEVMYKCQQKFSLSEEWKGKIKKSLQLDQ